MLEPVLTRWAHADGCVLGKLGPWHTLERPWKDNAPRVSCIPPGRYLAVRGFYHAGGYPAFELRDVPGRSEIKIHVGNVVGDSAGCPLVGSYVGVLNGHLAVLRSQDAYREWMASLDGVDEFWLTIEEVP